MEFKSNSMPKDTYPKDRNPNPKHTREEMWSNDTFKWSSNQILSLKITRIYIRSTNAKRNFMLYTGNISPLKKVRQKPGSILFSNLLKILCCLRWSIFFSIKSLFLLIKFLFLSDKYLFLLIHSSNHDSWMCL